MFGSLGGPEILLIFIVALIVFGPKRLPEIGRTVGGWVREFRKATGEFRSNIEREIGFDPMTGLETTRRVRRDLLSAVSAPILEVTEETRKAVREAREEAAETARDARAPAAAGFGASGAVEPEILPPEPRLPRPMSVPRQAQSRQTAGEEAPDSPGRTPPRPETPPAKPPGPDSPGTPPSPGPDSPGAPPEGPESPGLPPSGPVSPLKGEGEE